MKTNVCYLGDCLNVLPTLPDNSIDSIVTDPPYHLTSIVKRFGKEGSTPAKFGTDGAFKRASTGFMGKTWDGGDIAFNVDMWKECLRVLKPGGHLLSFSGTRTYHRMAVAIEDAGFEVRDMIEWCYGSGFPKSLNIGKAVDKLQGNEREVVGERRTPDGKTWSERRPNGIKSQFKEFNKSKEESDKQCIETKGTSEWEGWGTALKPAHEPICMARKPLSEKTVAENCLKWGTGGINIDESRVDYNGETPNIGGRGNHDRGEGYGFKPMNNLPSAGKRTATFGTQETQSGGDGSGGWEANTVGRFPANLIHDNSEEVRECFPETKTNITAQPKGSWASSFGGESDNEGEYKGYDLGGNCSRFFKSIIYQAKASKSERNKGCEELEDKKTKGSIGLNTVGGTPTNYTESRIMKNIHPTVKPTALMSYLIKMITPPGGVCLDPFAGSGSTLVAAKENGFQYVGIEMTEEYLPIIQARTGCEIIKPENPLDCLTDEFKATGKPYGIGVADKLIELEAIKKDRISKSICPECGGKIKGKYCEDCLKEY